MHIADTCDSHYCATTEKVHAVVCMYLRTCVMHKHTHMCTIYKLYPPCRDLSQQQQDLSRLVNCEFHS